MLHIFMFLCHWLTLFHFNLRTRSSYKIDLGVMSSLSFCCLEKIYLSFIHSFITKRQRCWVKYSWLAPNSFSTLNIVTPLSVDLQDFCSEIWCSSYGVFLYVRSFFLLLLLKFSVFDFRQFYYNVSWKRIFLKCWNLGITY